MVLQDSGKQFMGEKTTLNFGLVQVRIAMIGSCFYRVNGLLEEASSVELLTNGMNENGLLQYTWQN